MLFLFKNNEGKTMTNTIIYNEHYTDDDVRWIMQQVHDKEIIISLGLNEGESGALIGADLTKLKTSDDQMQLSIALLTAFLKLNEHLAPKQKISYLMDLVNIVVGQMTTQRTTAHIH